MKFTKEFGIPLDRETLELLRKGIAQYASKRQFALACKIPSSAIAQWLPELTERRQGKYITWDVWKNIRDCLISHDLLDPDNPQYLLPSEMRNIIQHLNQKDSQEQQLLAAFHDLTEENQSKVIDIVRNLGSIK